MADYFTDQFESSPRLISVAGRLLISMLQQELNRRSIDISAEEWRILFYLWIEDGINQKDLAKRSFKDKTTIARQLSRLEKKGLVVRKESPGDKRNRLIFLTKRAKEIEGETLEVAIDTTKKAEEQIPREDLDALKRALKQIIKNLRVEHEKGKQT